jgi:hypothetical protein
VDGRRGLEKEAESEEKSGIPVPAPEPFSFLKKSVHGKEKSSFVTTAATPAPSTVPADIR